MSIEAIEGQLTEVLNAVLTMKPTTLASALAAPMSPLRHVWMMQAPISLRATKALWKQ